MGVVGPDDEEFSSLRIAPEFRVGRAWSWQGAEPAHEAFHYLPAEPSGDATTVLARTATGAVLIARRNVGAGSVYPCTILWHEGPLGGLGGPALKLMDHAIVPLRPLAVKGLPVEWISTCGPGRRTVLIANHSEKAWRGRIEMQTTAGNYGRCTEWRFIKRCRVVATRVSGSETRI